MTDYTIISKGSYNETQPNNCVTVKNYMYLQQNGELSLVLRFKNLSKYRLTGITFAVVFYDGAGKECSRKTVAWSGMSVASGDWFGTENTIAVTKARPRFKVVYIRADYGEWSTTFDGEQSDVGYGKVAADQIPAYDGPRNKVNPVTSVRTVKMPLLVVIALCVLLAGIYLFSYIQLVTFRATAKTFDYKNLTYRVLSRKEGEESVEVTGYKGRYSDIYIPEKLDEFKVESIAEGCFRGQNLRSATILADVTLGKGAFENCAYLTDVNLGGVTEIPEFCFSGCTQLSFVNANKVKIIANDAFENCYALSQAEFVGVESVGENAFSGCQNIAKLSFSGDETLNVGAGAFSNCGIEQLIVTQPLGETGGRVFVESNVYYCKINNVVGALNEFFDGVNVINDLEIDNVEAITESFCSGVQLKTLTINSLKQTEIPAYAFYRSGLEKLNINVAPTKVGRYAFAETAISDFDFSAVKEIEPYAFADCTGLESVWLNTNIGVIVGEGAFKGCRNVTRAALPDDMTIVPDKLFSGAAKLTEVSFNGFTVGVESFFDCRALTSFAHTGHLRMVKEGAFDGCVNLQSVDLSGVESFEKRAFGDCRSISEMYLFSVISLAQSAFYGCSGVQRLSMPLFDNNLAYYFGETPSSLAVMEVLDDSVPDSAFSGAVSLVEVSLGNQATTIGNDAFAYCQNLQKLTLPDTVRSIGTGAFAGCSSLLSVDLPARINKISDRMFADCTSLNEVVIGEKVTSIGNNAFANCMSFQSFYMPDQIETIGFAAFSGCENLTYMKLPFVGYSASDHTYIGYIFGADSFPDNALPRKLNAIELSNKCRAIDYGAFMNCNNLGKIVLPSSIQTIYDNAFSGCTRLYDVVNDSALGIACGSSDYGEVALYALRVHGSGEAVYGHNGAYDFLQGNDGTWYLTGTNGVTDVYMPTSFTADRGGFVRRYAVPQLLFTDNTDITSVTIPATSVTAIGDRAFANTSNLTSVTFSQSGNNTTLTKIGEYAFASSSVQSVSLPSGLTEMGVDVFYGCYNLQSVDLSKTSLTEIPEYAFSDCQGLDTVRLPNSLRRIGHGAFNRCNSLSRITLPNTLEYIGAYAFMECTSLTEVVGGAGVGYIDTQAFSNDNNLTTIQTDKVTILGSRVFENCNQLTSFNIADGLERIYSNTFANCNALTNVRIPRSMSVIEHEAFVGCNGIKYVVNLSSLNINVGSYDNGCVAMYAAFVSTSDNVAVTTVDGQYTFARNGDDWYLVTMVPTYPVLVELPETFTYQGKTIERYTIGNYFCNSWINSLIIPMNVTYIQNMAMGGCGYPLTYYCGEEDQWQAIGGNEYYGTVYYFAKCIHEEGKQWTYDQNGAISIDVQYSGEWKTVEKADCQHVGKETNTCAVCGYEFSREVYGGHNYVDGKCTVCGIAEPTNPYDALKTLGEFDMSGFNTDKDLNVYSDMHIDTGRAYIKLTSNNSVTLTVRAKVSSEENFDKFEIYLNGQLQGSWSGETVCEITFSINIGDTVEFVYSKDGSGRVGEDNVVICEISY